MFNTRELSILNKEEDISEVLNGTLQRLYTVLVTISPTTMWNESCGEQLLDFGRPQKIFIGVMLAIITAVTVMGNTLVVIAVSVVKKLRQPSNYLLVSLAVADLSVAIVVMPFVIVTDLTGGKWLFGEVDVMCCMASVMTMCVISVDRPEEDLSTAQEIVLPAFMNPYGTPDPRSGSDSCSRPPLPPYSPYNDPSHEPSLSAMLPSSSLVPTGHSCMSVVSFAPFQVSSGPTLIPSPDHSTSVLPAADPSLSLRSGQSNMVPQRSPGQTLSPVPLSTPNPYPAPSYQVSVIFPSPDLHLSPLQSRCLENTSPDLECSICFSQFNNVFRCPKMLQCKHTFCLECLARINVKSAQPGTIQCPLCRGVTTLPALGLPTLATDVSVLTYLPAAMQRVYSVRFLRSKGRLQVKGMRRWRRGSDRSLDVGLPSPPAGNHATASGLSEALIQLTGRPACRAFLLTSMVLLMVLLIGLIIFLITFRPNDKSE